MRERRQRWVFPGYIFFQVPEDFGQWNLIRWAPGVLRVLGQDGTPGVLSDDVLEHIRRRLTERQIAPRRHLFSKGQAVQILSGPLRMVDAIFDRDLDGSARVQVLVQLLGRPLGVALDPAILRAAG